jgi:hypothetical protein
MGQGTGPLCTAGGSPGWVRHWEQSDLCRGQRPAAAAATAPGRASLPFRRNGITCYTILTMEFSGAILFCKNACKGGADDGSHDEALAPDLQRYFRDRAAVVKKHLDEIRAREEEELSDYCSDRGGGRYDAEVANGRGYYDASGKFHYHHVPNDEW